MFETTPLETFEMIVNTNYYISIHIGKMRERNKVYLNFFL